jgi:hypothetical protein
MPSVTVGKPNTCGIAPAAFTASTDRLVEVAVAESDRAQHGAVGRARVAVGDGLASPVVGHFE